MIYYAETGSGCCLGEATNLKQAENIVRSEVGSISGVKLVRKATKADVAWVRAMGGYVPETKKNET